jgi:hypothetical protein
VLWAFLVFFPSVGVGADAAGAGMATGLALIGFLALFTVYLMVLIPALLLFREGNKWPRVRATLNALLLVPAVVGLPVLVLDLLVACERQQRERAAYDRFASTARTTEYRAPDGTFSFRYAASPDGLELVEDDGGVVLLEPSPFSEDNRDLVGGLRVRRPSGSSGDIAQRLSAEYSALTGELCTVIRAREHPLEQLPPSRYQVFTLPNDAENDRCLYAYARLLGGQAQRFKQFYVFVPEGTPGLAFEVVVDPNTLRITGPVEDNAPGSERVAWYDTIQLEP